jgi:hypothetical protein
MTDCLEIKEKWFLPNNDRNKNNQVPGTLCYSPQQIELRLVGVFEDGLSLPQCDDPSKSIIHGISDDDKCFTLVDCISSHVNHIYFICKDPDCLLQSGPCFLIYTPDSNQPLQPVITSSHTPSALHGFTLPRVCGLCPTTGSSSRLCSARIFLSLSPRRGS